MPTRSTVHFVAMAALLFLPDGGDRQFPALIAAPPQTDSTSLRLTKAPEGKGMAAVRRLFKQHCEKCHGADGKGSAARKLMPEIPDFTRAAWQKKRSDAQLLVSILEGKGTAMPPLRDKLTRTQARSLVDHIRTFAPNTKKKNQKRQDTPSLEYVDEPLRPLEDESEELTQADPPEAKSTGGFFDRLIHWLGKFHPPGTHFPIALLTAAAVAEMLGMATSKPAFDTISRYCLWFGSLTALAAAVLGWFLGGFRLSDTSWVLTTHRWLGTLTAVCSSLVLLGSEVTRLSGRPRTWFRVALLLLAIIVLVTGFFGGAVVHGLEYYAWPQ
jgi:mono/diheme cytochrome c family protein/uncharacterized membrane protein